MNRFIFWKERKRNKEANWIGKKLVKGMKRENREKYHVLLYSINDGG